MNNQFA